MDYLNYYEKGAKAKSECIKSVMEEYLKYFKIEKNKKILDIGCGKGDFIELLLERQSNCLGIELNKTMADYCIDKGLPVKHADIIEFLKTNSEQYSGAFASHLVEHLELENIEKLFSAVYKALEKKGTFVVAFPNSRSIIMHLYYFYNDPTHKRFYSPDLIEYLLQEAGFKIELSKGNPATATRLPMIEIPETQDNIPIAQFSESNSDLSIFIESIEPFISIQDKIEYKLKILNSSRENKKIIFSFDIYPSKEPHHPDRHLGAWNINLVIPSGETKINVVFSYPETFFKIEDSLRASDFKWIGGFLEDGSYNINFILWKENSKINSIVREQYISKIGFEINQMKKLLINRKYNIFNLILGKKAYDLLENILSAQIKLNEQNISLYKRIYSLTNSFRVTKQIMDPLRLTLEESTDWFIVAKKYE